VADDGSNKDILESLRKSVLGDKNSEVIKAGTLAVTRGATTAAAGILAIYAVLQVAGFEGWEVIPPAERIWLVVATGGVWAIIAAADAVARGLATSKPNNPFATLPEGLKVTRLEGIDEPGWSAVALRWETADGDPQWLVARGDEAEWVATGQLRFSVNDEEET
jgi:hypothetical protein